MAYRDFSSVPLTNGDSIEKGSVGLQHVDPALYQLISLIKLHTHTGVDSAQLQANATPYVLKTLGPQIREEHGTAGGAGTVTFDTPFQATPTILVSPNSSTIPYVTGKSITGFTVNAAGGDWIAIGR